MEFLRDLFGSFTSGIIRLAVAVGVLAAAYFFIVKPVLHTTEHVSDSVNSSIESANDSINESFGPHSDTAKAIRRANKQVQRQIRHSFHVSSSQGGSPQKLIHCIQVAAGNVNKIQHCTAKFAP